MVRTACLLLAVCLTVTVAAAEYERRLLPIAVAGAPGAFGTVWSTEVDAIQERDREAPIIGHFLSIPGSVVRQPYPLLFRVSPNTPPGDIFYVRSDAADDIHISARIVQLNGADRREYPLPIVRESAFASRPFCFLQLNNRRGVRRHLRVYSLDTERADAAVRVLVKATWLGKLDGWTFAYDTVHSLTVVQERFVYEDQSFALRPLALELSLDPILRELPEVADLVISVVPVDSSLPIWAMLSETDNLTQRVDMLLPD